MAGETATETIYAEESLGSYNLKLVRLARAYRGMAITNTGAHISVMALLGGSSLLRDDQAFSQEVERMVDRLRDIRAHLVALGVPETVIIGYFPYQVAPITENLISLTARDSAPKPLFPGYKLLPPTAVPGPGTDDDGPKGQIIIDPFDSRKAVRASRKVEAQIEVTVWDDKGNRKFLPSMKVTLNVGPNGFEETGGELTVLKQKLKNQVLFGLINKVEISLKVEGKVDFDDSTARRLVGQWSAKVKSSLEFDLKIPKTAIKIGVELSLGVDVAGKPAGEAKFTVLEF